MTNPFLYNDDDDDDDHAHDADDEDDDAHEAQNHHHVLRRTSKEEKMKKNKNKRRLPLLLFTPTGELVSDTFRLAAIARDIGMDFHPTPSLSHLIFSWPTPSSPSSSSSTSSSSSWASSSTPSTSSPLNNNRPSVSSTTTTTSSSASAWTTLLPNDAVPLPFPSLSTPSTSLSLLRYFVSLSKGLFKLVFFNFDPESDIQPRNFNYRNYYPDSDCSPAPFLHSRVSSRRVGSMDDFSRELAGYGWTLFRNRQKPKCPSSSSSSSESDLVYLFRKKELNRVHARGPGGGGHIGECRVRELRLPALDFNNAVPLRILLYILLMTDDIFYLA